MENYKLLIDVFSEKGEIKPVLEEGRGRSLCSILSEWREWGDEFDLSEVREYSVNMEGGRKAAICDELGKKVNLKGVDQGMEDLPMRCDKLHQEQA